MSVAGGCEICQAGNVSDTCDRCGKLVCERHFDPEYGLCVECVAEVQRNQPNRPNRPQQGDYPDGVGEYRF